MIGHSARMRAARRIARRGDSSGTKKRKKLDPESAMAIHRAFIRHGMEGAKITGHSLGHGTSTICKAIQLNGAVLPRWLEPKRPSK
jgi:hypothetical protein